MIVTFEELQAPLGAGGDAEQITCQLLGEQWSLWFADEGSLKSTVLPRQAVCLLHQAVDRLKSNYEKLEDTKTAAASSYAVLTQKTA